MPWPNRIAIRKWCSRSVRRTKDDGQIHFSRFGYVASFGFNFRKWEIIFDLLNVHFVLSHPNRQHNDNGKNCRANNQASNRIRAAKFEEGEKGDWSIWGFKKGEAKGKGRIIIVRQMHRVICIVQGLRASSISFYSFQLCATNAACSVVQLQINFS